MTPQPRLRLDRIERTSARRATIAGRVIAALAGTLACLSGVTVFASAASAEVGPPIIAHSYYGPARVCDGPYAIDVRPDEAYTRAGSSRIVRSRGGDISWESWLYSGDQYRDIVHPKGEIALSTGVHLKRIELWSRNSPERRIVYLNDTHDGGPFPITQISATGFDGSDRDKALLDRLAIGEGAKTLCAAVPAALELRPDREDAKADAFGPDRPRGPLTVCWTHLAIDLRPDEQAILPWRADLEIFGIVERHGTTAINGSFRTGGRLEGRPGVAGVLLDSERFTIRKQLPPMSAFSFGSPSDAQFYRLLSRADIAAIGENPGPGVTVAFDHPVTDDEAAALIHRVRAQSATDHCYRPGAA